MTIEDLAIEISNFPKIKRGLGLVEIKFLEFFAKDPFTSAYQIYSARKTSKKKTNYKTVHHRVERLRDLQLIEKVEKRSIHGAHYYKLSIAGIYYLIHNQTRIFMSLLKEVLRNYHNNLIFKVFLFPYFMPSTLLEIRDAIIISKICIYLHDCLEEVERLSKSINNLNRFT